MAMSNAQRQAAYRQRHLHNEDARAERLNLVIDVHAKCALQRLAACYGVTQRALLLSLLDHAESVAIDRIYAMGLPNGQSQYYDKRLPVVLQNVTA